MGKIFTALRNAPKRTSALVAIFAAAIIVPATLFAWGPNRETYTIEQPADHIVFNSITNNPNIGDERNFVGIRESGTNNQWSDNITVQPGKEYTVRMYVHNNAASNLNLVAENVTAKFNLPTTTGKSVQVNGFLSSSNATPTEVYDHAVFNSTQDFNVAYIKDTLKYENNAFGAAGTALPESIFTSAGAKLGYDKLDGKIPGCFQYAGYVTFKVKPQFAPTSNFEVQKTVRVNGATDKTFKEDVTVKSGDSVDYQVYFKNTGETQLKNVIIKDTLPAGMTYVAGSSYLHNSDGTKQIADGVTTQGIDIGGYLPNGDAYVKFTAQVAANAGLPACGPNVLHNIATAYAGGGSKEDGADVNVPKECTPEPTYTCNALTVTKIDRTHFKFATTYTVQNATFKNVTYIVRNAAGTEVYRGTNVDYMQTTVGKYTVEAIVTVTVNGQDKTATSVNCKKEFEVVKEKTPAISIDKKVDGVEKKQVSVGQEYTYQIVVTNTGEIDLKNAVVTDPAPANVQFISADKGTIANNTWTYTIPELKIGQSVSFAIKAKVTTAVAGDIINTACVNTPEVNPGEPTKSDDCDDATVVVVTHCPLPGKENLPADSKDCYENCPIPGKEHMPKDSKECVTPSVTPSELPTTGAGDTTIAIIGLGALIASIGYYAASRRALLG